MDRRSRQTSPPDGTLRQDTANPIDAVAAPVVHRGTVEQRSRWMARCHIAEHNESGMMFNFDVLSPMAPAEVAP